VTRWTLPHTLESARTTRELVGTELQDSQLRDNAVLVASELVANAVDHGQGPVVVELTRDGRQVRLAVSSTSGQDPQPRAAGQHDLRGRGLTIVSTVADQWGWARHEDLVTVWALLTEP
jgi:anti-sigma regulatory factor (Ser/Thr protein kinase)